MDFGFLHDPDSTRFCYLRVRQIKQLLKDSRVLTALLDELQVPAKGANLAKLSDADKLSAIESQIEHFRRTKTSVWHGVHPAEVFAASVYRADKLSEKAVCDIFCGVRKEANLLGPVAKWMTNAGLTPYPEVPMGMKRIDVLGYKKARFFTTMRSVGIELKNEFTQFERSLDQMTTFREYTHVMYLACPPLLAAKYLDKYASAPSIKHWEPDALKRKLATFGFGLLLVEGEEVFEVMKPTEREPDAKRSEDLADTLSKFPASRF